MIYRALYVDNCVKAVFSSEAEFHKWLRVMYNDSSRNKKLRKEKKVPCYDCIKIEGIKQDDNYSIYLMQIKTDKEKHEWFSSVEEAVEYTEKFLTKDKHCDVVVRRVIVDYAYKFGLLEDDDSVIFRHNGRIV